MEALQRYGLAVLVANIVRETKCAQLECSESALAGLGLSLEDLRTVLARSTVDQPKGLLSGKTQSYRIAADDQLFGADAFRKLIVAHRGATDKAPENSMSAFARALDLGADAIECDVRLGVLFRYEFRVGGM